MPSISLLLLAFALGATFASAGREELRHREQALLSPASWIVLSFCVLFLAPSATYLMTRNLAWSLSYWLDPRFLPAWFPALLGLLYACAPFAGFLASAPSVRRGRDSAALAITATAIGAAALLTILGLPRLLVEGTYRQFQQDFGLKSLAGGPLGLALLWTVLAYVPVVAWTYSILRSLRPRLA